MMDITPSFYSPGAEISLEWMRYRFFSIGVSYGAFVTMDGEGAVLFQERLGIIQRLSVPVRSHLFFSIGVPFGFDWGVHVRRSQWGVGLFAAAMIGMRVFKGAFGFTADARCGPDYLWGPLYDVLITAPQLNLGAVYRF